MAVEDNLDAKRKKNGGGEKRRQAFLPGPTNTYTSTDQFVKKIDFVFPEGSIPIEREDFLALGYTSDISTEAYEKDFYGHINVSHANSVVLKTVFVWTLVLLM